MSATTFFGNRGRALIVTGSQVHDSSTDFTNGGTSVANCDAITKNNYLYNHTDDTIWQATPVASHASTTATLYYGYLGTTRSSIPAWKLNLETLAVLRGLELTCSWENAELYGTDSIKRVDVARHSFKNEFKLRFSKWDVGVATDWMQQILMSVTSPTDGTVEDVNTLYAPYVILYITDANSVEMEFFMKDAYFKGLPHNLPEHDFVIRELEGVASDVRINSYTRL